MDTNNKPATPLPWMYDAERQPSTPICTVDRREWIASPFRRVGEEQDAAYIAHAANAYPRLVAALRGLTGPGAECRCQWIDDECIECATHEARALLREIGEDA